MGKRREKRGGKIHKINVELPTAADVQAYQDLKALASTHGMSIQEVMVPAVHQALATLQKRTLPLNTVVRLSKNK